jgi:hypothetical protein
MILVSDNQLLASVRAPLIPDNINMVVESVTLWCLKKQILCSIKKIWCRQHNFVPNDATLMHLSSRRHVRTHVCDKAAFIPGGAILVHNFVADKSWACHDFFFLLFSPILFLPNERPIHVSPPVACLTPKQRWVLRHILVSDRATLVTYGATLVFDNAQYGNFDVR